MRIGWLIVWHVAGLKRSRWRRKCHCRSSLAMTSVTSLAHSLSLVCDLTLPSPSVSFLDAPGSTATRLHPQASERVFSTGSETDRRHLRNTWSAPVRNTAAVFSPSLSGTGCVQASRLSVLRGHLLSSGTQTHVPLVDVRAGALKKTNNNNKKTDSSFHGHWRPHGLHHGRVFFFFFLLLFLVFVCLYVYLFRCFLKRVKSDWCRFIPNCDVMESHRDVRWLRAEARGVAGVDRRDWGSFGGGAEGG